jgi:hypothetical protein
MLPRGAFGIRERIVQLLLLTLALVVTSAGTLSAQSRDRLIQEIESTERVLERARGVVEEHGNPRAMRQLRFAFELQANARRLVGSGQPTLFDARRAAELTQRARLLAQRAVTIASQQARLEQRARLQLERFDIALESARDRLGDAPSQQTLQLIEMAGRRLEQAREAFHEHRFREAIHLCEETTRLLQSHGSATTRRRFERRLENTKRLLERAQNGAAESDPTRTQLERAEGLIARAEESWASGRPVPAELQLRQARELLLRVMRQSEQPLDASGVDAVLENTAAVIDDVATRVRELENAEAMRFIDNAYRHLERARSLRLEGKLRQALEEARVARNLAGRAARAAGISQL